MRSRRSLSLTVLTVAMFLTSPSPAFGHGGIYRGPAGEIPPGLSDEPPPPPDGYAPHTVATCLEVHCATCTHHDTLVGADLAVRSVERKTLKRVGDLEHVRFTVVFRGNGDRELAEAQAPLDGGVLMSVTAGTIEHAWTSTAALVAQPVATAEAKQEYWRTREKMRDPLLVLPQGDGTVDIRAFPVTPLDDTTVTIEAWVVADRASKRARLYRTGDRWLCVAPRRIAPRGSLVVEDDENDRRVVFLTDAAARTSYPHLVKDAPEVPCVPDLERAARDDRRETWVALEVDPPTIGGGPPDPPPPPEDEPDVLLGPITGDDAEPGDDERLPEPRG